MHVYSFTYLFKHAVVISDYMAPNGTTNDERWIGSNAPAEVIVQFHVLQWHLTECHNENHAELRFSQTSVEIRTGYLFNTYQKLHSLSQFTLSFVFFSQQVLEVFKTFLILSHAKRSDAKDNCWSPAEWCGGYMHNGPAGEFAALLRRTSDHN